MKMLNDFDPPQYAKNSLQLIKKHLVIFQKNRKSPKKLFAFSKKNTAKIKGDLIVIYKDIMAPALKQSNKQIVARAAKRCCFKKINLFDEDE